MSSARPPSRAILLTPPGAAAIAVVRLLGPRVRAFLARYFNRKVAIGRAVHGELSDGVNVLDDPVVVLLGDEAISHTVADVNLHGGPWVVQSLLNLAEREGFSVTQSTAAAAASALPEEAVEADDLWASEVLTHLHLPLTELGVRALLGQPEAWRNLLAAIQHGEITSARLAQIANDRSLWWLLYPPRVAIVGLPNTGKSTLANQLFGTDRAITADLPGTTRDWVEEIADVNGLAVTLVDTPGIRDTSDAIESMAIDRAAPQIAGADLVVVVLDATLSPGPQQHLMDQHAGALLVVNKCDRTSARHPSAIKAVQTVATTGIGLDELRRAIADRFGPGAPCGEPRWWTHRQLSWLRQTQHELSHPELEVERVLPGDEEKNAQEHR